MKKEILENDREKYVGLLKSIQNHINDIAWVIKHHSIFHVTSLIYAENNYFTAKELARKYGWNGKLKKIGLTLTRLRSTAESSDTGRLGLEYARKEILFLR